MITCDCLEDFDAIGMSYDSFPFPCDTCDAMLPNKVKHVDIPICIYIAMNGYENFEIPPMVACNMMNNCSFPCVACNTENDDASHSLAYNPTLRCHTLLDMHVPHVTLHSHDDIAIYMP